MIAITAGIVLVGGLVVRVFDKQDFPNLDGALWYTLQSVTTVGYGDKVPTSGLGRVVGASVMLVAVALIAILTASITSTFVEAAQRRRRAADEVQERASAEALQRSLDGFAVRLAAIETILQAREPGPDSTPPAEDTPGPASMRDAMPPVAVRLAPWNWSPGVSRHGETGRASAPSRRPRRPCQPRAAAPRG
jgi:voltage-gated potassium channel